MSRTTIGLAAALVLVAALPGPAWNRPSAAASPLAMPAWQLVREGTGVIEDVATGAAITLPFDRRVHVAILAEGFTAADLAAGAFDAEVDRWLAEVLRIEPFDHSEEALVVWKRPLVSAQRLSAGAPQAADTALQVPLSGDGGTVPRLPVAGPTAARIWEALRDLPVPLSYYGPGGHSHRLARNLVVVVATMDPRTGRPGLSGRAAGLADPQDRTHRVAVAIGHGRAHEFGHAFALLGDEYMDARGRSVVDNAQTAASAFVSNVVRSPRCDELPCKHLLPGSPLAPPTHGLVGAFGDQGSGYHPELKCLMNGVHDNALVFGGDGQLRSGDRLCNFCREMATFRLLERTQVLPDQARSLDVWAAQYRDRFFQRFGFQVPPRVPQTTSDGRAVYQACVR